MVVSFWGFRKRRKVKQREYFESKWKIKKQNYWKYSRHDWSKKCYTLINATSRPTNSEPSRTSIDAICQCSSTKTNVGSIIYRLIHKIIQSWTLKLIDIFSNSTFLKSILYKTKKFLALNIFLAQYFLFRKLNMLFIIIFSFIYLFIYFSKDNNFKRRIQIFYSHRCLIFIRHFCFFN